MNYQQSYGKSLEKPNELEFFILLLYHYRLMALGEDNCHSNNTPRL